MADWTSIPDATFDPDRPVLGSTHLAIVKNFEALAEGAVSAPRVETAALDVNAVLNATARDALSRAVGTYTVAWYAVSGSLGGDSQVHIATGTNIAGSSLRVSSRGNETVGPPPLDPFSRINRQSNFNFDTTGTTTLAGTWKLMTSGAYRSRREDGAGGFFSWHPHLWLRIS